MVLMYKFKNLEKWKTETFNVSIPNSLKQLLAIITLKGVNSNKVWTYLLAAISNFFYLHPKSTTYLIIPWLNHVFISIIVNFGFDSDDDDD